MEQQNPAPVTQGTEVPPNHVVPLMSGKLISVPLSASVKLQLVSERHTRELVHQVHSAISQS
ncbi:GL13204 [Drosophila persimilis]|uniref:GL13204 n=1 Tax=Drosophila persimilis TaxID=7234 RepID=B4H3R2_DROPE|nr:GL15158 [Drosophila persimilis]EDW34908.1 GL13204 [Drosophila persimilis]